jgi:hypothetical protein
LSNGVAKRNLTYAAYIAPMSTAQDVERVLDSLARVGIPIKYAWCIPEMGQCEGGRVVAAVVINTNLVIELSRPDSRISSNLINFAEVRSWRERFALECSNEQIYFYTFNQSVGVHESVERENTTSLSITPNFTSDVVQCRYTLVADSFVRLRLYSITGNLVQVLFEGKQSAGEGMMAFDTRTLAKQIIIIR